MDEYAIRGRIWVCLIAPSAPTTLFVIDNKMIRCDDSVIRQWDKTINGPVFCQVVVKSTIIQFILFSIGGIQKCNGAMPIFNSSLVMNR